MCRLCCSLHCCCGALFYGGDGIEAIECHGSGLVGVVGGCVSPVRGDSSFGIIGEVGLPLDAGASVSVRCALRRVMVVVWELWV